MPWGTIFRFTHMQPTVYKPYTPRHITCHPRYIIFWPQRIWLLSTVYATHPRSIVLPTVYTSFEPTLYTLLPTAYIPTHGIYSDIPWGTCPLRYMHVPHGILYTVGNISDVLYGISPRYKNVPHGICPTVYKTYIPCAYTVGHNLYTVGNIKFRYTVGNIVLDSCFYDATCINQEPQEHLENEFSNGFGISRCVSQCYRITYIYTYWFVLLW